MRTTLMFGLLSLATACGGDPCAEYADLLCDCAEDDDMCDSYKATYENSDADQQDECSARLDEAEAASESCQEDEGEEG